MHTNSINNSDSHVSQGVVAKDADPVSEAVDAADVVSEVSTEAPSSPIAATDSSNSPTSTTTPITSDDEPTSEPIQPEVVVKPTNPYQDGTNEHYLYEKRESLGKTTGEWGSTPSWVSAARGEGVTVNYEPAAGSTAILSSGMAYHVDEIVGADAVISAYINGDLQAMKRSIDSLRRSSTSFIH